MLPVKMLQSRFREYFFAGDCTEARLDAGSFYLAGGGGRGGAGGYALVIAEVSGEFALYYRVCRDGFDSFTADGNDKVNKGFSG